MFGPPQRNWERAGFLHPEGRTVASLLGVASAGWACCRRHTKGHLRRNGAARNHEKRVTQKWLDEYEDRTQDEAGACPKGGLACTCIKLPKKENLSAPAHKIFYRITCFM